MKKFLSGIFNAKPSVFSAFLAGVFSVIYVAFGDDVILISGIMFICSSLICSAIEDLKDD